MTPFKKYGVLTEAQNNFNKKLSGTRILIENSFGLLKERFRQLQTLQFHRVKKLYKFIVCCCLLHNLCINLIDDFEFEITNEEHRDMVEFIDNQVSYDKDGK